MKDSNNSTNREVIPVGEMVISERTPCIFVGVCAKCDCQCYQYDGRWYHYNQSIEHTALPKFAIFNNKPPHLEAK